MPANAQFQPRKTFGQYYKIKETNRTFYSIINQERGWRVRVFKPHTSSLESRPEVSGVLSVLGPKAVTSDEHGQHFTVEHPNKQIHLRTGSHGSAGVDL